MPDDVNHSCCCNNNKYLVITCVAIIFGIAVPVGYGFGSIGPLGDVSNINITKDTRQHKVLNFTHFYIEAHSIMVELYINRTF